MIRDYWESFREFLAFKIYPELHIYTKAISIMGELNENKRVVDVIEQSSLRNKEAVIGLVKARRYSTEEVTQLLSDASEDQTTSDAS